MLCLLSRKDAREFTGFSDDTPDAKLNIRSAPRCVMKLDPNTKVASLLAAIPSSTIVFDRFKIGVDSACEMTLQQACTAAEIEFDDFLRAMDEIDWHQEPPGRPAGE